MSGGHDDYAIEPIPGLPEKPPEGEHILWQGAPSWWGVARDVFHIRIAALYLLALTAWRADWYVQHDDMRGAIVATLSLLPIALAGLGLLAFLSRLVSRTSLYTITNRRIVMRVGVALPTAGNRVAYSGLWPHVRPWELRRPQPMLRDIPRAVQVSETLRQALIAAAPAGWSGAPAADTEAMGTKPNHFPLPDGHPA